MYQDDRRLLNLETVNPCIVIASGDRNSTGIILDMNIEASTTLEFTRNELIGANLTTFIPKVYADHHNYWMNRYFENNKETIINTQRRVYAMNRRGFMIPCDLLVKVIPDLSSGIRIVGMFSKINLRTQPNRILIDANSGDIVGITKEVYENFGIHPALCYGNSRIP